MVQHQDEEGLEEIMDWLMAPMTPAEPEPAEDEDLPGETVYIGA